MARGRIATGASVVLYVNGKVLARCLGISWEVATGAAPIHALDSQEPYELAPRMVRVTGTIQLYRLERDGGAEGAGLTVPLTALPRGKYVALLVMDRRTESVFFQADKAMITSQRWNAPIKGIVSGTVSFEALLANGEAG